jgi:hypothetical protein
MDTRAAARRWADTWERAWPAQDVGAIAALYAPDASYRALAFREPTTAARYLPETFAAEAAVECRFGTPIVDGDRAAVEWWASWLEDGEPLTMAGTTVLRFDADGLVVDQRDYWNELPGRRPPYPGWG